MRPDGLQLIKKFMFARLRNTVEKTLSRQSMSLQERCYGIMGNLKPMPRRHFRRNGPNARSARLKFLYLRLVWRKLRLKRLAACNNFASHNADIVTNIYDKNNAELVTEPYLRITL
jgi:hypothetical protein